MKHLKNKVVLALALVAHTVIACSSNADEIQRDVLPTPPNHGVDQPVESEGRASAGKINYLSNRDLSVCEYYAKKMEGASRSEICLRNREARLPTDNMVWIELDPKEASIVIEARANKFSLTHIKDPDRRAKTRESLQQRLQSRFDSGEDIYQHARIDIDGDGLEEGVIRTYTIQSDKNHCFKAQWGLGRYSYLLEPRSKHFKSNPNLDIIIASGNWFTFNGQLFNDTLNLEMGKGVIAISELIPHMIENPKKLLARRYICNFEINFIN